MPRLRSKPHDQEHNGLKLFREIIALSEAGTWDEAKWEWTLEDVFFADRDDPGTCLCGHSPILENCVLVNRENGNTAVVGNVCVKKFLGLESARLFSAFNRIARDPGRALNAAALDHAWRKGWMNDWEREFYLDTLRTHRLSARQGAKRTEINRTVLSHVCW